MDLDVRCQSLEPTAHSLADALKPDVQARVGVVGLQQQVDRLRNLQRPSPDSVSDPGRVSTPAMRPHKDVGRDDRADARSYDSDTAKDDTVSAYTVQ